MNALEVYFHRIITMWKKLECHSHFHLTEEEQKNDLDRTSLGILQKYVDKLKLMFHLNYIQNLYSRIKFSAKIYITNFTFKLLKT